MAGENRPDLVLMDIMFDGDLDGIETAQRMRDHHDVPVIYLTAFGDQATFARAKQTLPLAFVLKPFDPKELYLTIETSLERRRLETDLETSEQRFIALAGVVRDGYRHYRCRGRRDLHQPGCRVADWFQIQRPKGDRLDAAARTGRWSAQVARGSVADQQQARQSCTPKTVVPSSSNTIRFPSSTGRGTSEESCLPSVPEGKLPKGKGSGPAVPLDVAIFAERVRVLYQKAISAIPTNLVTAAILIAVLWGEFDHHTLVAWGAANGILSALRLGLVIVYRHEARPPEKARQWANAFVAGSVLSGGLWGLSALVFSIPNSHVPRLRDLRPRGAMRWITTSAASCLPAFIAFSLPALLPATAVMLVSPDKIHVAMGVTLALYGIAMASLARSGATSFEESAASDSKPMLC